MPKFTLIAEHTDMLGNPDGTKIQYECYGDYIGDVLEHFDLFLRGCGYNATGKLDYIPDEEYYGTGPEWQTEEFDTPTDNVGHSEFYFDVERNK